MKKITALWAIAGFALLLTAACNQKPAAPEEPESKWKYESVEDDPLGTRIYTLDNGLKVYLSVNEGEPRIQTMVAVRTGSKQDPSDATGLAHYLEHMLFKGTSNMGTTNWEEEQKLLQQISDKYEEHRNTTDPDERKAIYKMIDSLSYQASEIAISNEYDKMIGSIGAQGTNAFTSLERTVYINDIPSNELEKWMMVESERFSELVLRLFHTELEAVYEEFNRAQDSDFRSAYYALMRTIFQKHTYGTQTTIGTGEHLKNPSMEKIHAYFDKHYVPNNMAIILAGDIDPDKTMDMIDQYFGHYEAKDVPEFTFEPEAPITEPVIVDVSGSEAEFMYLAYRMDGAGTKDALYAQLMDGMLSNGQAGMIDLNLVQQQKVLRANSSVNTMIDYSMFMLRANPRQGQSLEEVRDLLLGQIDAIKAGDFEDWLLDAVVKDLRLGDTRQAEYNWIRGFKMMDAFILDQEWSTIVSEKERMDAITKEELVAWANEKFQDNYVVVNKRIGEKDVFKVDKPEITEIKLEREAKSEFYSTWEEVEASRLEPVFLDYETAIADTKLESDVPFSYIENVTNEVFSLFYILDMGSDNDKTMELAVKYLPYLGTSKYSAEELQQEFFKLGLSFDVFTSNDRVYVMLDGLEDAVEEGVALFEEVLADVQSDPEAYQKMVDGMLKERSDDKLSKWMILNQALADYAQFGPENPQKNILSETELKAIDPATLVENIKSINKYKHRVFYYGRKSADEAKSIVDKYHKVEGDLMDYPAPKEFPELDIAENQVYFVDYDMVQTEMLMLSKGVPFSTEIRPAASLFNEYFGSGLSSIVFQEIRESKALAYSAYCFMTTPQRADRNHYVRAYIGTQVDKLDQATDAMLDLMNNMPEAQIQFEDSRLAALKKIETERVTKTQIFWNRESARRRGLDYDARQDVYEGINTMKMEDLRGFFNEHIKGNNYAFLVIGKRSDMDFTALEKLGPVKELTLEEIFGY